METKIMNDNGCSETRRCPQCGAALPGNLPPEQCPKCLLQAGLPTIRLDSSAATGSGAPPSPHDAGLPKPGDEFGHYRINRLLGRGGMGAVFDADDMANGRRVALKVISHTLDTPEARARFLREGRLAAAVNHPNSVYVFGTEEIAGTPVIAMELVPGGTLQDRVKASGPLPVGEAVDAVLQIIAGLEAAQGVGVLHRDIKPSNCFVDLEGRVKIGDFGLSISTYARVESLLTATGLVLGTPAFSSPEQLRGDELTVRSDIYAVGVTLYHLLTGRLPFEAPNLVQMLATVLERPAESPARFRSELPAGLCRVVLRCLEKVPGERYKDYAELRSALLPYASSVPAPAPLPRRFLAGCIDSALLSLPQFLSIFLFTGGSMLMMPTEQFRRPWFGLIMLQGLVLGLTYYAVLEGLWGASLGKRICRLALVRESRNTPGMARALLRALVFLVPPILPTVLLWGLSIRGVSFEPAQWCLIPFEIGPMILMALLFATARQRNGLAGLHDLASGTRVVLRSAHPARPGLAIPEEPPPAAASPRRIGPYHVIEPLSTGPSGEWLAGFDPKLLRRVWIHRLPSGSPPLPANLRNLGRYGRVRWLAGHRSDGECWDVYEALSGLPLLKLGAQDWEQTRFWLLDLAEEIEAASRDGSLPAVLALDRVWITAEGRAKLLDFPAPGLTVATPTLRESGLDIPNFLEQAARTAAGGNTEGQSAGGAIRHPLPVHAREFMARLPAPASPGAILEQLHALMHKPARVTLARRLVWLTGASALTVICTVMIFIGLTMVLRLTSSNPEAAALVECLTRLDQLRWKAMGGGEAQKQTQALELYIAGRFRGLITNAASWRALPMATAVPPQHRALAEKVVATHPQVSEEEFGRAAAEVKKLMKMTPDQAAAQTRQNLKPIPIALGMGWMTTVLCVVLPCLLASLLFRGGLLVRALGVEFVTANGELASRWRVAWRNLLAWVPFLGAPLAAMPLAGVIGWMAATRLPPGKNAAVDYFNAGASAWVVAAPLAAAGVIALALVSCLVLKRSLQDRLAGTFVVPR